MGEPGTSGLAYIALLVLIAAVAMPSLRKLRWLALASALVALAYLAVRGADAVTWVLVTAFAIVNALRIAELVALRNRSGNSPEERELLEHVLRIEEPERQRRLVGLLAWRDAAQGTVLMREGDFAPPLVYVASGVAEIEHGGRSVATCGPGDFLGEMSAALGTRASATVVAVEGMRIAVIDRDALEQLVASAPELGRAVGNAINRSLATKLARMNRAHAPD